LTAMSVPAGDVDDRTDAMVLAACLDVKLMEFFSEWEDSGDDGVRTVPFLFIRPRSVLANKADVNRAKYLTRVLLGDNGIGDHTSGDLIVARGGDTDDLTEEDEIALRYLVLN